VEAHQIIKKACTTPARTREQPEPSQIVDDLLSYALEPERSRYWSEQAIAWLLQGAPLSSRLVAAIKDRIATKCLTQQLRHHANQLIKNWETRSQGP
jgi:hypothetical protein